MSNPVVEQRLINQRLTHTTTRQPAEVVAWFGAVQAQEYPAARWAVSLRMADDTTDATIARAVDAGRIVRTHVLRPTWHFVAASDIGWMLALSAPRVQRALGYAYRRFELDPATCRRAAAIFERALAAGAALTRPELGALLMRHRIRADGIRLALLTVFAELEGVVCSGPFRGKAATYASFAMRVPRRPRQSRDEAIAELTRRYIRSHGPATIRDFVWWSGVTTSDARRGLDMIKARGRDIAGTTYWSLGDAAPARNHRVLVHLLPTYDEYCVAYRDRDAVPFAQELGARRLLPQPLVINGAIAGSWKAVRATDEVGIEVASPRTLTSSERAALARTTSRYGRFLGVPARFVLR